MSSCSFIATNFEMPKIESKEKHITVKEAIELKIKPHELMHIGEDGPECSSTNC